MTDAKSDGPAKEPGFPLSGEAIDGFAGRSAALGRILGGGEATNIVAAYEREDKRAIEEQSRFSSVATRLNRTVLVTAVIGAVYPCTGRASAVASAKRRSRFDQDCMATVRSSHLMGCGRARFLRTPDRRLCGGASL